MQPFPWRQKRFRCSRLVAIVAWLCLVFGGIGRAQLVPDGGTNVLDGITTNVAGGVVIGTNGSFTLLIVTNGARVNSSGPTLIGTNVAAYHNRLIITSPGSTWQNNFKELKVGKLGSFNELHILDGAKVTNNVSTIGGTITASFPAYYSHSNLVWVSGPGSRWAQLKTSMVGAFNQLTISNGATVEGGLLLGGISNVVTVTGAGSQLLGPYSGINLGYSSLLQVRDGAYLVTTNLEMSNYTSRNTVLISDPGTVWNNQGSIQIADGSDDGYNQLIISNGARLFADSIYPRGGFGIISNNVIITGANSCFTNRQNFFLGGIASQGNRLIISNGGALFDNSGYLGNGGRNEHALVTGLNSMWSNRSGLFIGNSSWSCQLRIDNSGKVFDSDGVIGTNGFGNLVLVADPGSLWTNSNSLRVGYNGVSNSLVISNGAVVFNQNAFIGYVASASNNLVIVTGPGSKWITRDTLSVGFGSRSNRLQVGDSGEVYARNLNLGAASALSNAVSVDGGMLIITNRFVIAGNGMLTIDSGSLKADELSWSNSSQVLLNGGRCQARSITNGALALFNVGDGIKAATLELLPSASVSVSGGLAISSNAQFKADGTITGYVTNKAGGTITLSDTATQVVMNRDLVLKDGCFTALRLNADAGSSDRILVASNLVYGGTLLLTNVAGNYTNGSAFPIFSATTFSGAFSAIDPPSPGAGLRWNTNRLSIDGALRVFALTPPAPAIANTVFSGGALVITATGGIPYDPCYLLTSTNVSLPLAVWERVSTNSFDAAGSVTFSNSVSSSEPERYFCLQVE